MMSEITEKIESKIKTINELFKNNKFKVPFYQRDYAWKKDEIDDLWNDLMDVFEGYQDSHFFGQIVTYNGEDVQDLIDGQQRLTTSVILMATIHKICGELLSNALNEDPKFRLNYVRKQIKDALKWEEEEPALRLQKVSSNNDAIHEYFVGIFNGYTELNENNKNIEPVKNIKSAFDGFYSRINGVLNDYNTINDRITALEKCFTSFADNFFVSVISTKNADDAFVIFETLNSRGKDLEPAEIIKTHLMSQIAKEPDKVKTEFSDKWNEISEKFGKNSEKLTKFIRIYWAASHRLVSSKQLYRSISMEIKSSNDTKSFLNDIDRVVDYYIAVDNSNKGGTKYKEYINDPDLFNILSLLRKLQVTLHYPVLFSMLLNKMSDEDMKKVLFKVLCIFIRRRTICMYGTNTLETGYASIAEDIWNQKIVTPTEINEEINSSLNRNDVEVESSFTALSKESANGAKSWTLKYLLFKLYQQSGDFIDMRFDQVDMNKFALYHIGNEDDTNDAYFNYVSNYMLIEGSISPLKDGASVALLKSSLRTNQKLGEFISDNGWNDEFIRERQNDFAKEAVQIW